MLEAHERAYGKRNSTEMVVADIKCPNGGGSNISWEGRELVGGEIKDSESRGPLVDVRYLNEFVIAEVELIETGQLKEATWDNNQFILLQIKLHYLKREGRGGREERKRRGQDEGREGRKRRGREEREREGDRTKGGREGWRKERERSHNNLHVILIFSIIKAI